tara:strand:+ start:880 stop:1818 length:939 start_codon:yes stop_codon:yes gene_type:complete
MALLARKTTLLVKAESSYATDASPSNSANAVLVRDVSLEPLQSDEVERTLVRGYLGNYETLLANSRAQLSATIELAGSGAAGTANQGISALLKSCGMSETVASGTSVTYAPVSASFSSCTIYVNLDGVNHALTGCRGTFSISASVGEIPTISFEMTGKYNNPADVTQPACTYQNQATPQIFKNGNTSSFQLMGYAGALESWSFDMNNEIVHRVVVGGTEEVLITDRKPSGSCTIESVLLASHNFFTDATGSSTGTNTWAHGSAGNKVTVSCPQSDIGAPSYGDSDGIRTLEIPFVATPTGSGGNNELSIVFA